MCEDNRIKIPEELGQVVEDSLRKVKKIHRRKVFCKVCLTRPVPVPLPLRFCLYGGSKIL